MSEAVLPMLIAVVSLGMAPPIQLLTYFAVSVVNIASSDILLIFNEMASGSCVYMCLGVEWRI
jgi:hypothetical protein